MRQNLYAHFLDRELRESLGADLQPSVLLRCLWRAALLTGGRIYCSYSHLWESGIEKFPAEVSQLVQSSLLTPVSDYHTGEEFLDTRLPLYHHDQARYPFYYSKRLSKKVLAISPSFVAQGKTTRILHHRMASWAGTTRQDEDAYVERAKRSVDAILKHRDATAITLALFRPSLSHDPAAVQAVRRQISMEYTARYLASCHASLLTGIHSLRLYDSLSEPTLFFDSDLLTTLLRRVWSKAQVESIEVNVGDLIEFIESEAYQVFITNWRRFIERGTSEFQEREPVPLPMLRAHLVDKVRRASLSVQEAESPDLSVLASVSGQLLDTLDPEKEESWLDRDRRQAVLLMVATDTEESVCKEALGIRTSLRPVFNRSIPLWFGEIEGLNVYLGRCKMGQLGYSGSTLATIEAIEAIETIEKALPVACYMPGICLGFQETKHKICDLIVATEIFDAASGKISERKFEHRGSVERYSENLISRVHMLGGPEFACHEGLMLTGTAVIDKKKEIEKLKKRFPLALGLEMEGYGFAAACRKKQIPSLVAKGICDWGYLKSDEFQDKAARNSVDMAFRVIDSYNAK